MLWRTIAGCSKFQTLKPTGSHSKGLFIDSCLLVQLWSRNVVSTCACQCVCVNVKCCVHVLGRTVGEGSQMCMLCEEGNRWWLAEFLGPGLCPISVIWQVQTLNYSAETTLYKTIHLTYVKFKAGCDIVEWVWIQSQMITKLEFLSRLIFPSPSETRFVPPLYLYLNVLHSIRTEVLEGQINNDSRGLMVQWTVGSWPTSQMLFSPIFCASFSCSNHLSNFK